MHPHKVLQPRLVPGRIDRYFLLEAFSLSCCIEVFLLWASIWPNYVKPSMSFHQISIWYKSQTLSVHRQSCYRLRLRIFLLYILLLLKLDVSVLLSFLSFLNILSITCWTLVFAKKKHIEWIINDTNAVENILCNQSLFDNPINLRFVAKFFVFVVILVIVNIEN